jgi:hypothetical protein
MSDEATLATHLRAQLVAAGVSLDVRTGPVREPSTNASAPGAVRDQCCFVLATGGQRASATRSGDTHGVQRPSFQVWVRSKREDYDGGLALAAAVHTALDQSPPATFIECRCTSSAPIWIQKNDAGSHEWSINVWCQRH